MPTPYPQAPQALTQLEYYLQPSWRTTIFHSWTGIFSNLLTQPWELRPPHHLPTFSWDVTKRYPGSLDLVNTFLEEIHRSYFPDLSWHHQTTPIHEGLHEQPPPHDQIHFRTLHPRNILPRYKDPYRRTPQTVNNPVQKTHWLCRTPTLPLQPPT